MLLLPQGLVVYSQRSSLHLHGLTFVCSLSFGFQLNFNQTILQHTEETQRTCFTRLIPVRHCRANL